MVAGVGGLNFFFLNGTKLGEGIDDVVAAVAAKTLVFSFVKNFDFDWFIGIREDF